MMTISSKTEEVFTVRFIDNGSQVHLELMNGCDQTLRCVEILTVFLKDTETPGGPSRAHIKFEALKSIHPKESAVLSHRTWIDGKPSDPEHDQLERLKVIADEVRPYVLDISWQDAEEKTRYQRIPVGHHRQANHMLYPKLEERLDHAKHALERATSENIIELCKHYLALLAEYRNELYKLPGTPGNLWSASLLSSPDIDKTRKAARIAIEHITQERNRTAALLRSFTTVSGYEAVEILNRRKYKGHGNWELRASGVRFGGGTDVDGMTIEEAVNTASLLQREEYIAQNAATEGRK